MNRNIFLVFTLAFSQTAFCEVSYIQTKQAIVRSEPKFYAAKLATLSYGDAVQSTSAADGWVKVTAKNKSGYIPVSSLTEQKIVFSDRDISKVKADSSDVVLAGKGFSPSVEANYKKSGTGGRFDLVDKMEKVAVVNDSQVAQFVKSGGLK